MSLDVSANPLLESFSCGGNELTSLDVSANPLLELLWCGINELASLDVSANPQLERLFCDGNELASIDVSANPLLESFTCGANDLTSLDVSANPLLELLWCGINELASLDLSANPLLNNLNCDNNGLASLNVSANPLLTKLYCSINELTSLDVSANPLLEDLTCRSNLLTSLDVSMNPQLESLSCSETALTSLNVSANPLLRSLICYGNELTNLDLSTNSLLTHLWCYSNELTSLEVRANPFLETLACNGNELTSLDVSANPLLEDLNCGSNILTSLDLSNNSLLINFSLSQDDSIQFICASSENLEIIQDELIEEELNQTVVNLFCDYSELVAYRPVIGLSPDTLCDAISYVDQIPMTIIFDGDTSSFLYTGSGDIYLPLAADPITIWASSIDPLLYIVIDSVYTLDSTTLAQGLDSTGVYHDSLCAVAEILAYDGAPILTPVDAPRPGFDVTYKMLYENRGTIPMSGVLGMKYDSAHVTFIDAEEMPISHIGDSLIWSYSDLQPFEQRTFLIDFRLNSPMDMPPLNDGDEIKYDVCMRPIVDDHKPDDNCYTLCQTIVNSFDPNDKRCLQGDRLSPDMVGNWLTYMIRFENTGSAEAVTVRIKDEIDVDVFDINSLTPIDASHPYHIEFHNENQVHFVFPEIYLPFDDANNDGYVTFRIRTLDHLILGDKIENQASIFFDFNFPIETNTALTEVRDLEVATFDIYQQLIKIKCSPNPAMDEIHITSPQPIEEVNLINCAGQIVKRIIPLVAVSEIKISLKSLAAGGYTIQAMTTQGVAVEKLMIN